MKVQRLGIGIAGACLLAGAHAATAQEEPGVIPVDPPTPADTKPDVAVPDPDRAADPSEIVVTANKRGEAIGNVPSTVSVITAETLEDIGAASFQDFASYLPGLSSSSRGAGENQVVIRGVTTGTQTSSTVGIVVDEAPVGSSSAFAFGNYGFDMNVFDLQRLELLSGPQGTLYGASTLGGLLKYVSVPPDPEAWDGTLQGEASRTRDGGTNRSLRGMVNVPVVIPGVHLPLGLRVVGFSEKAPGFVDNPARGLEDVDGSKSEGGRASLLAEVTPSLELRLGAMHQKITRDGGTNVDYDPHTHRPVQGKYDQSAVVDEPFLNELTHYSGVLKWETGAGDVIAASSYQDSDLESAQDQTPALGASMGTGDLIPYQVFVGSTLKKFSQELRFASTDGDWLEWQVGGFYTRERAVASTQLTAQLDLGPIPLPVPPILAVDLFTHYREFAGFGDVTVHLADRLDLGLGARYAVNLQDFRQQNGGILGSLPADQSLKKSRETVTTWLLNPRWRLDDSTMAYARIASGYRPGGPNFVIPPPFPPAEPTFDADTLWNYELGIKASPGNRFTVDFDIYWIEWSKIQLLVNQASVNHIENGSDARIIGAEVASTWRVADGFTLGGNMALSRSELTKDAPGLQAEKGSRLPLSPRFSAALTGDYRWPFSDRCVGSAGVSYRYVGKRPAGFDDSSVHPQYILESYGQLDLRTGLQWGHVGLALFVRNALDEDGGISADTSALQYDPDAPVRVTVMPPRTAGMTLTLSLDD